MYQMGTKLSEGSPTCLGIPRLKQVGD